MKRTYCNKCKDEVNEKNVFFDAEVHVAGVNFSLLIEETIPVDYDVCRYCVLDAIKALDDRPKCHDAESSEQN
jgi:hypothetical protein